MSEYTTLLERVGDRVAPPSDAFERLTTRRRRKHRNRRFGAGVLALLVAAAGIGGAYVTFHQTKDHPLPVSGTDNFHAIFPAFSSVEAAEFQSVLDKGMDPRLGSEFEVAERFAVDILGWEPGGFPLNPVRSGVRLIDCQLPPQTAGNVVEGPCLSNAPSVHLDMAQLVKHGSGGAWFVTGAQAWRAPLNLRSGQDVKAGSITTARVYLPEGTRVIAGYGYLGQSSGETVAHTFHVHHGLVSFPVASSDFAGTHPVNGLIYLAVPNGTQGSGIDPFGQYFNNRVVAVRGLTSPPGMNQGGPSGVSFSDISAVPVRFVPAGAASTDYFIRLPAGPGAIDSKGLTILDAATNLPEGTLVSLYFSSKDEENPDTTTVHDGMIPIRVANNYCHLNEGNLTGSAWTIEVTIAPMYPSDAIGGRGLVPPPFYTQPASVLAILGQHFENLYGDQVTQVDGVNQIKMSKDYQLPANTCTDRIVYIQGGDFRQVPVTPSP
jgi:hypothetical protein